MRRVFTGVRHAALGAVSGLSRPSNAGVFALSAVSRPLATAASLRPQSQSSMRIRVTKQETARAPVDAEESSEWSDVEVDSDKEVEKKAAVAKKAKVAVQTVAAPQVDSLGRAYAIGRRKTSVAQVWIKRGTGNFVVNTMPHVEYFPRLQHRIDMAQPFRLAKAAGMFDVFCTVRGGGKSGASCSCVLPWC